MNRALPFSEALSEMVRKIKWGAGIDPKTKLQELAK